MSEKSMNRRSFIQTGAAASLAALAGVRCQPARRRLNILFIMSDDHAAQAVSCYDGRINRTPNIDRIAGEGARFINSFCTNAICAPGRASLLTGKYSHINGQIDNNVTFDGGQPTFPKLLQATGYETALVGKWHLKSDPTGFDYWNIVPDQGHYYNPDFIEMGVQSRREGYATDLTTDFALEWLKQRQGEKPFCLLLHHKAPHRNWMPAPRHYTLYRNTRFPVPDNFFDDYAGRSAAAREQEMEIARHMLLCYDLKMPLTPEELAAPGGANDDRMWRDGYERMTPGQRRAWDAAYQPVIDDFRARKPEGGELALWKYQRYLEDYLATIAAVDENIGRVLDYLDAAGLSEDTLVVYTSDNGFFLGEHGWFDKRFMYEESLRTPLVMRYPRAIVPGRLPEEMVLNIDLAPTFLDYAGAAVPAEIQGASLRPLLAGRAPAGWRQSIYYHYYEHPGWHMVKKHYGVRTQRYKLIHFYDDIDAWEFYDLQEDPREIHNLYGDPASASIIAELKTELQRLRAYYREPRV